ncbi:HU family DNA-binding protein [Saccharicrinis sp. FJH2]|uniref:HU family DNA-binding protein n=1 Tax=Saccharicrinis sp. FJH65 TaxID=3344659 RepID=UPI0035F3D40D
MALRYKIVSTNVLENGQKGRRIWFPKLTGSQQMNLNQIAKELQKRTTASGADVYLVIKGLVDLIPVLLADGYTLKLDELGTFRLHAKVEPSDYEDAVTVRNIKELHLKFRADNALKTELKKIKVLKG